MFIFAVAALVLPSLVVGFYLGVLACRSKARMAARGRPQAPPFDQDA